MAFFDRSGPRRSIRLVKLVSPNAARAHIVAYTAQTDHFSLKNSVFAGDRDVLNFAYFPVFSAYWSFKELMKFGRPDR